jgi:hypothetical protein
MKIGEKFQGIGIGDDFMDMTPKHRKALHSTGTTDRMKRQNSE